MGACNPSADSIELDSSNPSTNQTCTCTNGNQAEVDAGKGCSKLADGNMVFWGLLISLLMKIQEYKHRQVALIKCLKVIVKITNTGIAGGHTASRFYDTASIDEAVREFTTKMRRKSSNQVNLTVVPSVENQCGKDAAISPVYIYRYFRRGGRDRWLSLGGIMLSITGTKALFADQSHFPVPSIQIASTTVVFPCLLFAYSGQAAYLMKNTCHVIDVFYSSIPVLLVATAASDVASQATICAPFSLIKEATICTWLDCSRHSDAGDHIAYDFSHAITMALPLDSCPDIHGFIQEFFKLVLTAWEIPFKDSPTTEDQTEEVLGMGEMVVPFLAGILSALRRVIARRVSLKSQLKRRLNAITITSATCFLFPVAMWDFITCFGLYAFSTTYGVVRVRSSDWSKLPSLPLAYKVFEKYSTRS
uniref:K+ potassium transporter integral membrane domain-containing protein n=1 Tax=Salix viminalis TaxID=40686 RepID=A0A6N2M1H4_SALVM